MSNAPALSLFATGTIEPSRFVTLSDASNFYCKQSGSGDKPLGVSQEFSRLTPLPGASTYAATTGEELGVYTVGQVCYLECGTAITRGDYLKPDANGKALNSASTNKYGAVALESGASGNLIRVQVREGAV
jgi:hypothetical protein